MSDDNNSNGVEVSVGWNSSSPKGNFKFPESPVMRASQPQASGEDQADSGDSSCIESASINGMLGKYSAYLPGSSPPQPRRKILKRKHESPLKRVPIKEVSSPDIAMAKVSLRPAQTSTSSFTSPYVGDIDLTDESSDDSDFEAFIKAKTAPAKFSHTYFFNRRVRRFVVQRIEVDANQLILHCTDVNDTETQIKLNGSWSHSKVFKGDTIHLISPSLSQSFTVSDETDVYAVINPDVLVPCTSVAEALSCERQVLLRSQVRAPADLNENLVLGSIKHEFLQTCFTNNLLNNAGEMYRALKAAALAASLDLQFVGIDPASAIDKLMPLIATIQKWAMQIWGRTAPGQNISTHRGNKRIKVRLNRSVAIEEEIRSPYLGLIGKIDVTAEATDFTTNQQGTSKLVALEIKTGRVTTSLGHRAQTALYTLLLSERHPNNTHPWSLLYYTETSMVTAVIHIDLEMRALFQKRNLIAYEMWKSPLGSLPVPQSPTEMTCKWCARQDSCVLYTAIHDKGKTWNNAALETVYEKALETGRLTPKFLAFIEHWHHLIELEYDMVPRHEKQRLMQWWLNVTNPIIWSPSSCETHGEMPTQQGYIYTMTAVESATQTQAFGTPQKLALAMLFQSDERLVISTKQHMGVTFGYVLGVTSDNTVKIYAQNKLFTSGKYRLDSDPFRSNMHLGMARYNLNCLMENDRLRELLVDMIEPRFSTLSDRKFQSTLEWASSRVLHKPTRTASTTSNIAQQLALLSSDDDEDVCGGTLEDGSENHSNLNEDQTLALNKVLSARDYALILGMPGTGKTTTIAAIVASLVKRGKSVLVTAFTNSAVDTIVMKLLSSNVTVLRLAASLKDIHPDVLPVSASASARVVNGGGKPLMDFLESPVIACTSHSAGNKLFALRQFDYCILDEASQITLPFCIGPLRLASTFVLVGDHYQLPPLVHNTRAKELGLAESLFKILCEAHPQSMVELSKQYRMSEDIMKLTSDLVYNGRLTCGTTEVANQKLHLPLVSQVLYKPELINRAAIEPENSVVFLDTDPLGTRAHEKEHTQGCSNVSEAEIIQSIVHDLSEASLSMTDVAVISVYRRQLEFLSDKLKQYTVRGLEVLTADQAQGREKKCILVSMVRSNEKSHSGELLKDWRRLNVTFTRAQQKLIIVGSKRTMQRADGVAKFFQYIEQRGWVHNAQIM